jgi:hypothetical protein
MRRRYPRVVASLVGCANCGLGYPPSEMHEIDDGVFICATCHKKAMMNMRQSRRGRL